MIHIRNKPHVGVQLIQNNIKYQGLLSAIDKSIGKKNVANIEVVANINAMINTIALNTFMIFFL